PACPRPGTPPPGPLLRQRQPDPRRPTRRAHALRGLLARADRVRPRVAVHRLARDDLPRAVAAEPAGYLVRDHPAARGGHPATPGAAAGRRLAEGRHRHAEALPPAHPLRGRARPAARLRGGGPAAGGERAGPGGADAVPVQPRGADRAWADHPLRGEEPGGGWLGEGGELLPPGLP